MRIDLYDTHTIVSIERGGKTLCKAVSIDELAEVIGKRGHTGFGLLPENVRYIETKDDEVVLCYQFPKQLRKIQYVSSSLREEIDNVACPAGVMIAKFRRESNKNLVLVNSYIYAIRGDRLISDNDYLYKMPFPNVYEDNRICWGTVIHRPFTGFSGTESLVRLFWSSAMNSDLFNRRLISPEVSFQSSRGLVPDWLHYLSGLGRFEDTFLVRTDKRIKQAVMNAF